MIAFFKQVRRLIGAVAGDCDEATTERRL